MNTETVESTRSIASDLLEGTIKFFLIVYISTSDKFLINAEYAESGLNVLLDKIEEEAGEMMKFLGRNLEIKSELLAEIITKEINEKKI